MTDKQESDVKAMSQSELRQTIMKLRHAIRKHRDKKDNARCWHNDLELYANLPEEKPAGKMTGSEDDLLRNCKKYIRRQQCNIQGCENA